MYPKLVYWCPTQPVSTTVYISRFEPNEFLPASYRFVWKALVDFAFSSTLIFPHGQNWQDTCTTQYLTMSGEKLLSAGSWKVEIYAASWPFPLLVGLNAQPSCLVPLATF